MLCETRQLARRGCKTLKPNPRAGRRGRAEGLIQYSNESCVRSSSESILSAITHTEPTLQDKRGTILLPSQALAETEELGGRSFEDERAVVGHAKAIKKGNSRRRPALPSRGPIEAAREQQSPPLSESITEFLSSRRSKQLCKAQTAMRETRVGIWGRLNLPAAPPRLQECSSPPTGALRVP